MQNVGHHLQVEALRLHNLSNLEADTYARSSFNRYYYATFLCVRKCLVQIDKKWENGLAHKDVPALLRGEIRRRIKSLERKASRVEDLALVTSARQATSLTLNLAATLEKAYAIRVVADYNPDTRVNFLSSRFDLSGTEVTDAHDWLTKAESWARTALGVLKQTNE